jgi:uncharacterized protein
MNTSWYKEPWAWLVVLLPLAAVVASISTYIIANHEPDSLVIGDYYKKGKAINQDISKVKVAQKLGIKFSLKLTNQQLVLSPSGIEKKFPLLNLNFYHPTQADKDFTLKLTQDALANFRTTLPQQITGKWRVTVTPFDQQWKIQQVIYLPQTTAIEIQPDLTSVN